MDRIRYSEFLKRNWKPPHIFIVKDHRNRRVRLCVVDCARIFEELRVNDKTAEDTLNLKNTVSSERKGTENWQKNLPRSVVLEMSFEIKDWPYSGDYFPSSI